MRVNLSDSEWKLMNRLWEQSPRTIMELTAAVKEDTGWSKNTVITMLVPAGGRGAVRHAGGRPGQAVLPGGGPRGTACARRRTARASSPGSTAGQPGPDGERPWWRAASWTEAGHRGAVRHSGTSGRRGTCAEILLTSSAPILLAVLAAAAGLPGADLPAGPVRPVGAGAGAAAGAGEPAGGGLLRPVGGGAGGPDSDGTAGTAGNLQSAAGPLSHGDSAPGHIPRTSDREEAPPPGRRPRPPAGRKPFLTRSSGERVVTAADLLTVLWLIGIAAMAVWFR